MSKKLEQAREWAARTNSAQFPQGRLAHAAAEIIQSLPDHIIDAEKLREVVADHHIDMSEELMEALGALLVPNLPTLADMTQEERAACRWMQCKITYSDQIHVIARPELKVSALWREDGYVIQRNNDMITPLPDLPKLQWPGNEVVASPALPEGMRLADHKEFGRGVVSPEMDAFGSCKIFYSDADYMSGAACRYVPRDDLTFIDTPRKETK